MAQQVAAPPPGAPQEIIEEVEHRDPNEKRQSLLDVVVDEYAKHTTSRTSRLLVTAEINKDLLKSGEAVEEVAKFHSLHTRQTGEGKVTGCCFFMDKEVLVHLMEGTTPQIMELLRRMSNNSPDNIFKNARVCSLTEEVPRVHQVWAFRSIVMQAEQVETITDWLPVIFDTLQNFIELGRELAQMSAEEAMAFLTEGQSKQLLLRLPPTERVRRHSGVEDLMNIDEYLEVFDKPIHFTLEGEQIWPTEAFLKY